MYINFQLENVLICFLRMFITFIFLMNDLSRSYFWSSVIGGTVPLALWWHNDDERIYFFHVQYTICHLLCFSTNLMPLLTLKMLSSIIYVYVLCLLNICLVINLIIILSNLLICQLVCFAADVLTHQPLALLMGL